MIDFEPLKFLLRRRLNRVGFCSERINELLEEFTIEEMTELGIFNETNADGKLQCTDTTIINY